MDRPTVTLHPEADGHDHARQWLAHVEAGRIGKPQPSAPENLANLRRWEAVLLAGRLGRGEVRYWVAGR